MLTETIQRNRTDVSFLNMPPKLTTWCLPIPFTKLPRRCWINWKRGGKNLTEIADTNPLYLTTNIKQDELPYNI
jgi:hypothetical protein